MTHTGTGMGAWDAMIFQTMAAGLAPRLGCSLEVRCPPVRPGDTGRCLLLERHGRHCRSLPLLLRLLLHHAPKGCGPPRGPHMSTILRGRCPSS